MKYEIKQINDTDAVVISDEEIKEGDYYYSNFHRTILQCYNEIHAKGLKLLNENRFGTLREVDLNFKVIATIAPFKIEGLPMLELPNKTPIIDTFWLEKLCYYDRRNPDNCIDKSDLTEEELSKPQVAGEDYANILCSCDNCFYGRTRMAEKYISELPNQ